MALVKSQLDLKSSYMMLTNSHKHGFVILTHLPYMTVKFLRVEIEKGLFLLASPNKIYLS